MSSQEITEDAGAIKRKVEQQSVNIMEWSAEIDMAEEASKLGWPGMNATTEAFKSGDGVAHMTPTRGSKAQVGVSPVIKGKCWRYNQEGHSRRDLPCDKQVPSADTAAYHDASSDAVQAHQTRPQDR